MAFPFPAFVSATVCIYFRLHIEFRSRALTLTSCLRIDLITWHSSQARVPRSYQLFILEHGASRRIFGPTLKAAKDCMDGEKKRLLLDGEIAEER